MDPFVRLKDKVELLPEARVVKARDYLAYLEADQVLAEARRQAEGILADARSQLEAERARGYEEGMAQAKAELAEQMLETVGGAVDYFARVEKRVADVVASSVRKILGELDDHELILRIVKNALQVVRNQRQVTLRVSPDQEPVVRERIGEILAEDSGTSFIEVVPDYRLQRGGCILETEVGVVDASAEVQLAALEKALKSRIGLQARS